VGTITPISQRETKLPGDIVRTAWYLMDGPADRPHTVAECHVFIEQLLAAVGELTGITNAAAIPPWEPPATGPAYDITSGRPEYTGPALRLTWRNGVGVARADDPRCPVPWVLVPTSLLNRLATASDDPGLAAEVIALVREAPTGGHGPNGECSLCGDHAAAGSDICAGCIARGNPA
jgi:hypothetical protein